MKKLKPSFVEGYIYENRLRVIINICFVVAGVIAGCVLFHMSSDKVGGGELENAVDNISKASGKELFISSLKDGAVVCAVFYICSLFYIGEFLSPMYVFIRCCAMGFSSCLIAASYEMGKAALMLLSLVPQMIFYIPALVIFSVETAKQSRFMIGCSDKNMYGRSFLSYLTVTLLPVILIFIGCLVEGFCVPYLILWCVKKF